ncbi:MAG: MFS transporter [Acidobacteria bacterium]|nr:MAG: MFS transporter [Acidobacteriota bacterium]PYY24086.1 MAG: MFS transporter [Acidobacteriota bacterium]
MQRATRPLLALALLTALNFLNYIDRYILPAVQPLIKREFHPSDTALGALTMVFILFYMCVAPGVGFLADRKSRKTIMAIGALIWSAATLLTAVTYNFTSLLIRHTVVGVGEATFSLIAPAYIADLFPPEKRGRVLSFFYLAIPMGAALGYIIGGALGTRYGWRSPFYVCAIPGFIVAVWFYFAADEPLRGESEVALHTVERTSFRGLLRNPAFWTATLGLAMMTFAIGGISVWMPTFLERERGIPLDRANYYFGLITVIDGLAGTAVGGWLGDIWLRRSRGAYYAISGLSALLALPGAVYAFYGHPAWIFPSLAIAEFFLFLNTGPLNAAIVNSVAAPIRATAIGINLFIIHLFGDAFSPVLIGAISDRSSLRLGFSVTLVAMVVSAGILFMGTRFAPPRTQERELVGASA